MNEIQRIAQQLCINCTNCANCGNNSCQNNQLYTNLEFIANSFIIEYYKNVSNTGWNAVMYLFDHQCTVMFRDKYIGNSYDLLNALSIEYIKRANYDILRTKWLLINQDTMLLQIFGNIQFVQFNGNSFCTVPFTETFVLKNDKTNIKCTHHIIDY